MKRTILIVDDEAEILEVMAVRFGTDYSVLTSPTTDMALEKLRQDPGIVAVIVDKDKPKDGEPGEFEEVGLRMLETVREKHPTVKRILMSGRIPFPPVDQTLVHAFWEKPFLLSRSVSQLGEILS